MGFFPTAELVSTAWVKEIQGVPANGVATKLPGDPTAWEEFGFVQITVVGGAPSIDVGRRSPVIQLDFWANNRNSAKPPWGKARNLAETVFKGCYDPNLLSVDLEMPEGYNAARVFTVYPMNEPRSIISRVTQGGTQQEIDEGFARIQFDVTMHWAEVSS